MKNKTVEVMVRTQFNLETETDVNVEFLWSNSDGYHFKVWWFDNDTLNQVNCVLPALRRGSRDMTTGETIYHN